MPEHLHRIAVSEHQAAHQRGQAHLHRLIELEHEDVVRDTRHEFQGAMRHKFVDVVEQLSGRVVTSWVSNHHVGPDLAVELFVLEPFAPPRAA